MLYGRHLESIWRYVNFHSGELGQSGPAGFHRQLFCPQLGDSSHLDGHTHRMDGQLPDLSVPGTHRKMENHPFGIIF